MIKLFVLIRVHSLQNNIIMRKNNRRNFLQKAGALTATAFFSSLAKPAWARNLERALRDAEGMMPADILATEEDFWYYIQQSFTVSPGLSI